VQVTKSVLEPSKYYFVIIYEHKYVSVWICSLDHAFSKLKWIKTNKMHMQGEQYI
jgi:hypothetical protein